MTVYLSYVSWKSARIIDTVPLPSVNYACAHIRNFGREHWPLHNHIEDGQIACFITSEPPVNEYRWTMDDWDNELPDGLLPWWFLNNTNTHRKYS